MLNEKIQELEIELDASKAAREKEGLTNEIDALNCVLGHLFNLKSGGNIAQPIEIAEANNNFQLTNNGTEQIIKT
jgi:hypothetical protein